MQSGFFSPEKYRHDKILNIFISEAMKISTSSGTTENKERCRLNEHTRTVLKQLGQQRNPSCMQFSFVISPGRCRLQRSRSQIHDKKKFGSSAWSTRKTGSLLFLFQTASSKVWQLSLVDKKSFAGAWATTNSCSLAFIFQTPPSKVLQQLVQQGRVPRIHDKMFFSSLVSNLPLHAVFPSLFSRGRHLKSLCQIHDKNFVQLSLVNNGLLQSCLPFQVTATESFAAQFGQQRPPPAFLSFSRRRHLKSRSQIFDKRFAAVSSTTNPVSLPFTFLTSPPKVFQQFGQQRTPAVFLVFSRCHQ